MHPKSTLAILLLGLIALPAGAADDKAKPKITYQDHVAPIFASRCNSCHNADKQKGGLALETFGATMQGGGSGKVVEPGDVAGSHLWGLVSHTEEPRMPPKADKLPDAELNLIKAWIEGGALETSGSVAAIKEKPKFEFKLDPSAMGKPVGPPAMPEGVSTEPFVLSPKANAVVAMASSPWAPLVAVAGHKQVLLYHATTNRLLGVFPFAEGTIHVLKFSRSGALLLAGGGRGGQSGLAVVFDVKTGKRVFEIGKEYDVVLAADISPDHGQVALGGPSKVVRVYGTADGALQFEMKKHTEWVTAVEFSPDGVLLATGDRNNGLVVWEAQTGREFFDLRGHTAAITDVTWRLDSNVVASAAEDGTVRLWEMENGGQIKGWGAHGGGVTSARFAKDGRIVTTGRDRRAKVFGQDGGMKREFEPFNDLALKATFADDDRRVVAADWSGEVRVFDSNDGRRLANLAANPESVVARLDKAKAVAQAAQAALDNAAKELAPLQLALADKSALAQKAQQVRDEAQAEANRKAEAVAALEKAEAEKVKQQAMAGEALKLAQAGVEKANAEKANAEKSVAANVAAEKAAADAIPGSKQAVEKALNDKVAHDPTLASAVEALKSATAQGPADQAANTLALAAARSAELANALAAAGRKQVEAIAGSEKAIAGKKAADIALEAATGRIKPATDAVSLAQASLDKANADRAEAGKLLADARTAAQATKGTLDARKAEFDGANIARLAAEKALNDRKPTVDALAAKAAEAKAEVDALAAEPKPAGKAG